MLMKLPLQWLTLSSSLSFVSPCPFGAVDDGNQQPPNDGIHQQHSGNIRRRRLTPLSDSPDTKQKLEAIISDRRRSLQSGISTSTCVSETMYDGIVDDIRAVSDLFLDDNVSRAHFLGGIVRLAAHDFMDYDITDATNPMGMDGCIDFGHSANAGLSDIWCDGCDLTAIYNAGYASSVSRADFWVASANAVILNTSNGELDLKDTFAFGRVTAETCVGSATRLPEDSSCNFVEDVFLNRLDMTWTNAVALLGAHTLGRGSINFSGHDGIWVDTVEESIVFDKRYYEEIFRRAWVPRNLDDNGVPQDFTWGNRNGPGGNGSPRFMLNTDLCLAFDIDVTRSDNAVFPCCTRNDLTGNNGNQCENRVDGFDTTGLTNHTCNPYLPDDPRIEAANAVNLFSAPRTRPDGSQGFSNDNTEFFEAFREAWSIATTNGLSGLQPLTQTCDTSPPSNTPTAAPQLPTSSPSSSEPSRSPSRSPSKTPSVSSHGPSKSPSALPVTAEPTSESPTSSPSILTSSPTASCIDAVPLFIDNRGRDRDCEWVVDNNRCNRFAHHCQLSCGECDCLLDNRVCEADGDCCSTVCLLGQCSCLRGGSACASNEQCCSGNCSEGQCRRA